MDNHTKYNILENYLDRLTDYYFIKIYSNGDVSVSAYIKEKQINLDGNYELVYTCVKALD